MTLRAGEHVAGSAFCIERSTIGMEACRQESPPGLRPQPHVSEKILVNGNVANPFWRKLLPAVRAGHKPDQAIVEGTARPREICHGSVGLNAIE